MTQNAMIEFGSANVPAFARTATVDAVCQALMAGVGPTVTKLSIRGRQFAIVVNGERRVIPNPKDPSVAAAYFPVVVLTANPANGRAWYAHDYDPNDADKNTPPDCASLDGVKPDVGVAKPQSDNCASCPHAVYGTGKLGKGFACGNHKRLAVAAPAHIAGWLKTGQIEESQIMRLQVPGGALRNLAAFGGQCAEVGAKMVSVVCQLGFDPEETSFPKLTFTPQSYLPDAEMVDMADKAANTLHAKEVAGIKEQTAEPAPVEPVPAAEPAPVEPAPAADNVVPDDMEALMAGFDD